MTTAIKVENLSKAYQLGKIGTGTVSRDLERWWVTKVLGKEDPFLKIGETNDRATKGTSDIVWSLKDINFEIQQGDAVGIIGRNGAGKSTLLKILSRVTAPTTGKINIKGRVASLLEVGTGFHPELSGRENIFLNGAILGMRKKEIARKFDEIVDFSGVERYIDTPVKRYSSGMYVRLAFAVAAHLESEILIVDEVLAVGDAEFQKKCLGKMGEVSKGEGRTVLFVSHNLSSVQRLCKNAILLKRGKVVGFDDAVSIINQYKYNANEFKNDSSFGENRMLSSDLFTVSNLIILDEHGIEDSLIEMGKELNIKLNLKSKVNNPVISIYIYNSQQIRINQIVLNDFNSLDLLESSPSYSLTMKIKELRLVPDEYYITLVIEEKTQTLHSSALHIENAAQFRVENRGFYSNRQLEKSGAIFYEKMSVDIRPID